MSKNNTERQEKISRLVEDKEEIVTVDELSALFKVSKATIRRDLEELSSQGLVRRQHGGASKAVIKSKEPPLLQRSSLLSEEKKKIGKAAADLIADGETIFLGSGSTVLEVARQLKDKKGISVISNSLPVINAINSFLDINIIVVGGMLRKSEQSMLGHITEKALKELRADKVIMGIQGIHLDYGLTNNYLPETTIDRNIINISEKLIIVADHTKFGQINSAFVADCSLVDTFVTDSGISPELSSAIINNGLSLIVAK